MSLMSRYFASLSIPAGVAAAVAVAPVAAAEPALPEPGSEDAAATISDLEDQGYEVQVNYDNGVPNVDLSQCRVNDIDTADAVGSLKTVYVDVECPN